MNTTRTRDVRHGLLWGATYGIGWSFAPGILSELMRQPGEAGTVLLAAVLTGALVACVLVPGLAGSRWQAVILGVLSLPLGAGVFGFIISRVHWTVMKLTGTHYHFVMEIDEPPGHVFDPVKAASDYALYATCSPFAVLFIPLAILTTLHLRSRLFHFHP